MSLSAIILLGAPGAGKGTMAEVIREVTNYSHVSTGEMLREAIRNGTAEGSAADKFMSQGALVPDDLILNIVMARLDQGADDARYLFDGFPRTLEQAQMLENQFARRNARLERVFLLAVSRELSLERLGGRRLCKKCGANFHVRNIPPKVAGVCDHCGGELIQRPDDSPETIRKRLEVYERQTAGLIAYYEKKDLLVRIDASGPRAETVAAIMRYLDQKAIIAQKAAR
jgi:adenylate kinase